MSTDDKVCRICERTEPCKVTWCPIGALADVPRTQQIAQDIGSRGWTNAAHALLELASTLEREQASRSAGGRRVDEGAEPTVPETPGTWEERCAALYQVVGCLAHTAGIFETSDDVGDALDVATGRGNVFDLLPWPKNIALFRQLEEKVATHSASAQHIWCDACEAIKPLVTDLMGGKDVTGIFDQPTDLMCGECKLVIATTYRRTDRGSA